MHRWPQCFTEALVKTQEKRQKLRSLVKLPEVHCPLNFYNVLTVRQHMSEKLFHTLNKSYSRQHMTYDWKHLHIIYIVMSWAILIMV